MLTVEQLRDLTLGDVVEIDPLLPALSADPVSLVFLNSKKDGHVFTFVASYLGATLGQWSALVSVDGKITWIAS